jgi:hypothetical protein
MGMLLSAEVPVISAEWPFADMEEIDARAGVTT